MFTRNLIEEGMILRQQTIKIKNAMIKQILLDAGVNCQIKQIDEPHSWVMQSQRIHLTDGRSLLLKAGVNPDWTEASTILSQVKATELIKSTGIPQPNIISYSTNQEEYGFLFVLSEYQRGGEVR